MKKLTAIILTAMMIFAVVPAAAFSIKNVYINGDVDRNGSLKIQDANLIQRYLVNMTRLDAEQMTLADFDLSGKVNISDVTEIQLVLNNTKQPPSEPETEPQTQETEPETQPQTQATEPTEPTAPNPKVNSMVKIGFTNNKSWSKVYFYLYDSLTGTPQKSWPGTAVSPAYTNEVGEKVYTATVDTDKYDRIIFTDGSSQTVNIPVNKASSGFFISDSSNSAAMLVGTYALSGADGGKTVTTTLRYPDGYNKKIWVWTPADYSASSAEKFRTLYVLDGQNLFDSDHQDSYGGWEVTDAVESMMANGGRGVIIVGIDNTRNRDSELTPDLGAVKPVWASDFSSRTGDTFRNFVVNTVMPYVQNNFNSSAAAADNMIAGSSSGGLEAFYIGMEHRDKFSMIGALSPAFLLFDEGVWNSYLSRFDFTDASMPRLYIYNGNGDFENQLYPDVITMYSKLVKKGYSDSKIKLSIEQNAAHNEAYWRIIFPECISWGLDI